MNSNQTEKSPYNIDGAFLTAIIAMASTLIVPKMGFDDFDLIQGILLVSAIAFGFLALLLFFAWKIQKDRKESMIIRALTYAPVKLESPVILDKTILEEKQKERSERIGKRMNIIIASLMIIGVALLIILSVYSPSQSKDCMIATINNEELNFSLMSAVKGPVGPGETSIGAVYYCINPHHDIRYSLIIQMEGNTGPGKQYTEQTNDAKIQIILTKGFIFDVGLAGDMYAASTMQDGLIGKFSFEITDRDEKRWTHYHGKMTATLPLLSREHGLDKTEESYEINYAEFDFTITDDISDNISLKQE